MLRLAVLDAVLGGAADVGERVAVHPEPVHAGVGGVAVVTLHPQLHRVEGDRVGHASDVCRLRILNGEVLYGGAICIVLIVTEQMRVGVHLAVEALKFIIL